MSKMRHVSPGWAEAKRVRREKRDALRSQGLLKPQARNPRGFIIKKDANGSMVLAWDTQQAYNEALVRARDDAEEQFAVKFERDQKRKANANKRPDPKAGPVTVTKTKKEKS